MIESTIIIALATAFILLVMGRTGVRGRIIAFAPELVSKAMECDLCASWWINLTLAFMAWVFGMDYDFVIVAVCATPITRILI